jgi:hypothetical protein
MSGTPTTNITGAINRINSLKSQIQAARTSSIDLGILPTLIRNVSNIADVLTRELNTLFSNLNELDISGINQQVGNLEEYNTNLTAAIRKLYSLIPIDADPTQRHGATSEDTQSQVVVTPGPSTQQGGYNWRSKSKSRSKSRSKSSSKKSTRKNKKSKSKKYKK